MFKRTRAIGIDIGAGCVKALVLRQAGAKLQVASAGTATLPEREGGVPPDAAALGRAIRRALQEAGVRGRVDAVCGLPRHMVATRVLTLPGVPSERLARAAVLEAGRTLPFPPTEVVGGAQLKTLPDSEECTAIVAAGRSEVIANIRAGAAAAGVNLIGLGVSSLASIAAAADEPAGTWVLLEIGAYATTIDVVTDHLARTGRVALLGGEQLTQAFGRDLGCDAERAEERKCREGLAAFGPRPADAHQPEATEAWIAALVAEIRLLLAAHAAQGGDPPAGIVLAGGGSELMGLAGRLEQALGIACSAMPLRAVKAAGVERPLQYAAVYGLALMAAGKAGCVDLLASEVREERATRQRQTRRWATSVACAALLVYGGLFAYRAVGASRQGARARAAIAREVQSSKNLERGLQQQKETLVSRVQSLHAALRPETPWVLVLDDLAARAPQGIWLTGIELERGKPLIVRGTALQPDQAAGLVNALATSPYLSQVHLSYANEADLDKRKVTQFGITALVRGNAPEARPAAARRATKPKAQAEEKAQ